MHDSFTAALPIRAPRLLLRPLGDPADAASARVAERIGMHRKALLVEAERFEGARADTLLVAVLAREHRLRALS